MEVLCLGEGKRVYLRCAVWDGRVEVLVVG